jgi:hypothetical protein
MSEYVLIDQRTVDANRQKLVASFTAACAEHNQPRHPAKFTLSILTEIGELAAPHLDRGGHVRVLDPFAGVGGIHDLHEQYGWDTVGVEIEPEWAGQHPRNVIGNVLDLMTMFEPQSFDAVITSPCYGNRMADKHEARDASVRHTYKHYLGHQPHKESAAVLQWGQAYRDFHYAAWEQCVEMLAPGGIFVLNISDHIRKGERQRVTAWHVRTLLKLGLDLAEARRVDTPRMLHGSNRGARVTHETVALFTLG